MLNIMVCEGDVVLVLNNVEAMSTDEFVVKLTDCLTDAEQNIYCDLAFEGSVMSDADMKEYDGIVRECSFEDYIKDLKEFCENYYGDDEE